MQSDSMLESNSFDKNPGDETLGTDRAPHQILDSDQVHAEGPTREQIAALAYQLWVERGSPHGSHEDDWRMAEEQLRGHHESVSKAASV